MMKPHPQNYSMLSWKLARSFVTSSTTSMILNSIGILTVNAAMNRSWKLLFLKCLVVASSNCRSVRIELELMAELPGKVTLATLCGREERKNKRGQACDLRFKII